MRPRLTLPLLLALAVGSPIASSHAQVSVYIPGGTATLSDVTGDPTRSLLNLQLTYLFDPHTLAIPLQFETGTPPFIIDYNASSVPILQLGISGKGLSEQQLNDPERRRRYRRLDHAGRGASPHDLCLPNGRKPRLYVSLL